MFKFSTSFVWQNELSTYLSCNRNIPICFSFLNFFKHLLNCATVTVQWVENQKAVACYQRDVGWMLKGSNIHCLCSTWLLVLDRIWHCVIHQWPEWMPCFVAKKPEEKAFKRFSRKKTDLSPFIQRIIVITEPFMKEENCFYYLSSEVTLEEIVSFWRKPWITVF